MCALAWFDVRTHVPLYVRTHVRLYVRLYVRPYVRLYVRALVRLVCGCILVAFRLHSCLIVAASWQRSDVTASHIPVARVRNNGNASFLHPTFIMAVLSSCCCGRQASLERAACGARLMCI